jgi:iron complex transport system substrate-binding protein
MKIVSLLPAATEIVCLLGLRESLVGRSHACDYPAGIETVPVMTYEQIETHGLSGAAIDAQVSAQLRDGLSLFGLHDDALKAVAPDVILTQALCAVCAVPAQAVQERSALWGDNVRVLSLAPRTLDEMLLTITQVADACGVPERAVAVVAALRARLEAVRTTLADVAHRPTVAALEWLDPPFTAGHWVPEQIALAGGQSVLGAPGAESKRGEWDDLIAPQPEMVVMLPCGFDVEGATSAFMRVSANEVWRDVPATYLNQLYTVDANAYFSRPGPRLVDGVEILAGLLHPNRIAPPTAQQARRVSPLVGIELNPAE